VEKAMVETPQEADEQRRLMGLDLPFTAESAAIARKQLVDWMRQLDAHVDNRHDARLVLSELVGNSVRHARPLADGTMHVAWNAGPAGLDIAVTDGGALSTPEKVDAGVSDLAGRGLAIVETLASRWWVESSRSRTTVHALLELAPTPA
jgi:anti-sigma regulatory factor (Ser/Thr protein kinase)